MGSSDSKTLVAFFVALSSMPYTAEAVAVLQVRAYISSTATVERGVTS